MTPDCHDPVRLLALAVVLRARRDLCNLQTRDEAFCWFTSDSGRIWIGLLGLDYCEVMQMVSEMVARPVIVWRKKPAHYDLRRVK